MGAMLGHGGVVVADDTLECGQHGALRLYLRRGIPRQCTPCRIGSTRGMEVVDRLIASSATERHDQALLRHDRSPGGQRQVLPRRISARPPRGRPVDHHFDPASTGHPARDSATQVAEHRRAQISVLAGTSVMRLALLGTSIPNRAPPTASKPSACRLCMVEIDGMRGYSASAPRRSQRTSGTQTPRLADLRRNVMELHISDHPLDRLTCSANVTGSRRPSPARSACAKGYAGANHLAEQKDTSNPYFDYEPSKCIVCSRVPREDRCCSGKKR